MGLLLTISSCYAPKIGKALSLALSYGSLFVFMLRKTCSELFPSHILKTHYSWVKTKSIQELLTQTIDDLLFHKLFAYVQRLHLPKHIKIQPKVKVLILSE